MFLNLLYTIQHPQDKITRQLEFKRVGGTIEMQQKSNAGGKRYCH